MGIYFLARPKSTPAPQAPTKTPPQTPPPQVPQKYTCQQCRKEKNTKDNPVVERRYCSQTCWEAAKREQKETEVKIAKGRMLDFYKDYFTEQELSALFHTTPHEKINYSTSTLEAIADKMSEIIKKKNDKPFDKFPADTKEFKEKYEKAETEKWKFFYVSLIPYQKDGKLDWIKWEEQKESIEKKEASFKKEEIKRYLENKTNPALKTWSENYEEHSDPVKRLEFLNKQVLEHINLQIIGYYLIKQARQNGFLEENDDVYKDGFNASYEDASGNYIETTFPLITEYDLSKW